jgi:hypothetical protein
MHARTLDKKLGNNAVKNSGEWREIVKEERDAGCGPNLTMPFRIAFTRGTGPTIDKPMKLISTAYHESSRIISLPVVCLFLL